MIASGRPGRTFFYGTYVQLMSPVLVRFIDAIYRGNVIDILTESALKERFSEAMNSATTERAEMEQDVKQDEVKNDSRSFRQTIPGAYENRMGRLWSRERHQ